MIHDEYSQRQSIFKSLTFFFLTLCPLGERTSKSVLRRWRKTYQMLMRRKPQTSAFSAALCVTYRYILIPFSQLTLLVGLQAFNLCGVCALFSVAPSCELLHMGVVIHSMLAITRFFFFLILFHCFPCSVALNWLVQLLVQHKYWSNVIDGQCLLF